MPHRRTAHPHGPPRIESTDQPYGPRLGLPAAAGYWHGPMHLDLSLPAHTVALGAARPDPAACLLTLAEASLAGGPTGNGHTDVEGGQHLLLGRDVAPRPREPRQTRQRSW